MFFNSFEFLIFLPIVFLLYWFVFRNLKWQNLFIVGSSYLFYGWWDFRFLFLIAFTSICSYCSGLLIERFQGRTQWQHAVSIANIVLNIGILCVFKYYNFFIENLDILLSSIGWHIDWITLTIVLPVGISFYTFQALSYTIDVYQRKLPATHDIVAFFAYISFFPQLVAGPIERATNLLPQFQEPRQFDINNAVDGLRQMLWGFSKKIIVADSCAIVVNTYWNNYSQLTGVSLLVLGILFSFQIYCDFSGYSDIAIGTARLLGFNLMRNFNNPYFSRNIADFWRRWHISLTSWLRDYIYFPLGGNRCNLFKTIRNIYIVWLISGLWHGAAWTFVFWGLYHATLLVLYHLSGIKEMKKGSRHYITGKIIVSLQIAFTFLITVIGWIIFRADNIHEAYSYISRMFITLFDSFHIGFAIKSLMFGTVILFVEWLQRDKQHALQFSQRKPFNYRWVRWAIYYTLLILIAQYIGNGQSFIYFQF